MSYGASAALQASIYQRLSGDAAIADLIGDAIYDAIPGGVLPTTYVSLGDEDVRDRSDKDAGGAQHDFIVRVATDVAGFQTAKMVAGAVSDALLGDPLALARGRVTGIWFLKAKARRVGSGDQRQIELRFRAQVQDE